jgi:hypothetical protein
MRAENGLFTGSRGRGAALHGLGGVGEDPGFPGWERGLGRRGLRVASAEAEVSRCRPCGHC